MLSLRACRTKAPNVATLPLSAGSTASFSPQLSRVLLHLSVKIRVCSGPLANASTRALVTKRREANKQEAGGSGMLIIRIASNLAFDMKCLAFVLAKLARQEGDSIFQQSALLSLTVESITQTELLTWQ